MMIAEKSDNINGEKGKNQTIPPIQKQPPLTPWSALFQMIFYIDTSWGFFLYTNVTKPHCSAICFSSLDLL